jgi:hypothetical protein
MASPEVTDALREELASLRRLDRARARHLAEARREVDELAQLLGEVYPYVGFPYDPDKSRALWDDFVRLMVEVEETLERHPGAKVLELDPGNVRELPPGRRPRRRQ